MKIYTKGGDEGVTGLYGGDRVPKDHLRIQAYGTLDELNATIGRAFSHPCGEANEAGPLAGRLQRIQSELFQLGAELATPPGKSMKSRLVLASDTTQLESEIDEMESVLQPLKSFILPGGTRIAAELHVARTVCRRAERELIILHRSEPQRTETLQYMNRLSDYLFVAARFVNHSLGTADIPWMPA